MTNFRLPTWGSLNADLCKRVHSWLLSLVRASSYPSLDIPKEKKVYGHWGNLNANVVYHPISESWKGGVKDTWQILLDTIWIVSQTWTFFFSVIKQIQTSKLNDLSRMLHSYYKIVCSPGNWMTLSDYIEAKILHTKKRIRYWWKREHVFRYVKKKIKH